MAYCKIKLIRMIKCWVKICLQVFRTPKQVVRIFYYILVYDVFI